MNVFLLTHSPSPYQVELFNEVVAVAGVGLRVVYLFSGDASRRWKGVPIHHEAVALDGRPEKFSEVQRLVEQVDLAVFNYYDDPFAAKLIRARARSHKPWTFWGERQGVRKPEWLGRLLRGWRLRCLRRSHAPIWGIGRFAVEQYRKDFGERRAYRDIPYFSDLNRFENAARAPRSDGASRVVLFSGSLIERKGVDLLALSFLRVSQEFPHVRLQVMGDGRLGEELRRILNPVSERVEFLGFKDWADLPAAYRTADVLCVPSRYDGWGLVVPEGLASGLPVIATDRMGAALEFLETGRNGWLIRAQDEHALYTALRDAASLPPEKLLAMAEAARDSVKDHSLRDGAQRFLAAAREAVGNWRN